MREHSLAGNFKGEDSEGSAYFGTDRNVIMYKRAPINNDIKVSSKDRNKLIYNFHKESI